jgi:hypothetical protein
VSLRFYKCPNTQSDDEIKPKSSYDIYWFLLALGLDGKTMTRYDSYVLISHLSSCHRSKFMPNLIYSPGSILYVYYIPFEQNRSERLQSLFIPTSIAVLFYRVTIKSITCMSYLAFTQYLLYLPI